MSLNDVIVESIKYLESNEDIVKYSVLYKSNIVEVQKVFNKNNKLIGYQNHIFKCA